MLLDAAAHLGHAEETPADRGVSFGHGGNVAHVWDIVPGAMALVSNTPPQAGRVLCTTRVLYRYSAFVGGSMHPYAHDTVKTLAGKRYIMRPRYGPSRQIRNMIFFYKVLCNILLIITMNINVTFIIIISKKI